MRKTKLAAVLVSAALCAGASGALAAGLTLPPAIQEIGEEAFAGVLAFDTVALPESVTSIGTRAFAGSSLKAVYLPPTLTSIADDAFEGCEGLVVTADKGSYAYAWAVRNKYIVPDSLTVFVTCPVSTAKAGESVTWTA